MFDRENCVMRPRRRQIPLQISSMEPMPELMLKNVLTPSDLIRMCSGECMKSRQGYFNKARHILIFPFGSS